MRDAWDGDVENVEDVYVPANRGFFVDVKTLARAQLSRAHTLGSLAASLKTNTQKASVETHGGPLTAEYIQYARRIVVFGEPMREPAARMSSCWTGCQSYTGNVER